MTYKETRGVACPHCGAPYRKVIPHDVLQLKCGYCGATYQISPHFGDVIPSCHNHPERFATGICNDCEENFCRDCLHYYDFKTREGSSTLHLCQNCLRSRQTGRADVYLFSGMALTILGIFIASFFLAAGTFFFLAGGAFLIIVGAIEVFYGTSKRREAAEKLKMSESTGERLKKAASPYADTEKMFNELLKRYVEHWGTQTGTEFLESEIKAYTWRGETFADAVRKVYERQKKKN